MTKKSAEETKVRQDELKLYLASIDETEKDNRPIEKDTVCAPVDANLVYNIRKYAEEQGKDLAKIIRELLMLFALDRKLLPTQLGGTNGKYIPTSHLTEVQAKLMLYEYFGEPTGL